MRYLFLVFLCFAFCSPKQKIQKDGTNPIIFIDSVNVNPSEVLEYDSNTISLVTVYKEKEARDLYGKKGKDGVIYIETIPFSKNRYQNYFKNKSTDYKRIIEEESTDENIQYILNGEILTKDFEGKLALINDEVFKKIEILNTEELLEQYKISRKKYGVLITSDNFKD